ncbi:MAG: hypothetical protein J6Y65_01660, partial [Eggerthellaceae bacterium]|nr:hypothetical protein [Eggerthellaceae bacterium]
MRFFDYNYGMQKSEQIKERVSFINAIRGAISKIPYTARMVSTFVLVAATTGIVTLGVVSFVWENHFNTYTNENMGALVERLAENIADGYADGMAASSGGAEGQQSDSIAPEPPDPSVILASASVGPIESMR